LETARAVIQEEARKSNAVTERKLANKAREVLRARGAKVIPHEIDLWSAVLFLAPLGDEEAQELFGMGLRNRPDHNSDSAPLAEILFEDRRYAALLFAALDAHPDHNWGTVVGWFFTHTEIAESARLVDWFCATHPMRMYRIERDLKTKMREQGWRV
jgi:hypothetical protein